MMHIFSARVQQLYPELWNRLSTEQQELSHDVTEKKELW